LVEEVGVLESMEARKGVDCTKGEEGSGSEDDDQESMIERRNSYVRRCIRSAQARDKNQRFFGGIKNPVAAENRRTTVREFLKDIANVKKCSTCNGSVLLEHFLLAELTGC
jgi:DNA-directed RNA polymerase I subunit RPA1